MKNCDNIVTEMVIQLKMHTQILDLRTLSKHLHRNELKIEEMKIEYRINQTDMKITWILLVISTRGSYFPADKQVLRRLNSNGVTVLSV